ncbi:hypothetical protein [Paenisporosarcina sp.]|uniref:hypothetical protein n=1 Tax=Paenisporosarcina sp. TaxID=1932001 RepID=UPI003C742C70
MNNVKKRYIISAFLVLLLLIVLLIATNPTKQEYLQFNDWEEKQPSIHVQIERINFYVFSTYTPVVAHEHGMTHLGIIGDFYQISDGQFDYPWWLEFFN